MNTPADHPAPAGRLAIAGRAVSGIVCLGVLVWFAVWCEAALAEWSRWHRCLLISGPFMRCPDPHAWKTSLLLALLPLAAIGLWATLKTGVSAVRGRPVRRGPRR